ncbi:MAG: hypothetical protein WAN43_16155 [Rhodomicrobium sp.]
MTGVGTQFMSPDGVTNWTIGIGDRLICANAEGRIGAINSATSLSLSTWTGGVIAAGASYVIDRYSGMPDQTIAGLIQSLLSTVSTAAITAGTINGATIGLATPAAAAFTTISLGRQTVADANATVSAAVATVAYTSISAARTLTLPAAASYAAGQQLLIIDESLSCSSSKTITVSRAGSDLLNGATSSVIASAGGSLSLESNGVSAWTSIRSSATIFAGDSGSGGTAGLVPAPPAGSAASGFALLANGLWGAPTSASGFVNKFIDANFDVAFLGNSGSVASGATAYTLEGWLISATGTAAAWSQVYQAYLAGNSLRIAAAPSLSACSLTQRIESSIAAELLAVSSGPQAITVQFAIYNGTSSAITPTLSTGYASTRDAFGTVTADLAATSLQSIAAGTAAVVAYTFTPNVYLVFGYQISLNFGSALNASSGFVQIGRADVRATPGLSTGLNSSPPTPELAPTDAAVRQCQRYFETSYDLATAPGTATVVGASLILLGPLPSATYASGTFVPFKTRKRADPTILTYSPASGASGYARDATNSADVATVTSWTTGQTGVSWKATVSAATENINLQVQWTANSRL